MSQTQSAERRTTATASATPNQEQTKLNIAQAFIDVALTPILPSNNQSRSSQRRRRLLAQLKLESIREANARGRLQSILDSATLLRELDNFGSNTSRHYPSLVARVVHAAAVEEDRIFHIGLRVSALRARVWGYK
jgi:hypothetical protein